MNKTLKAADEVRKLHRMFAALGDVVAVLDSIGSLEQAESESMARVDALNTQFERLRVESDLARAEAARILAEATTFADGLTDEANIIVATARSKADTLIATAREVATKVESDSRAASNAAAAQLAETEQAVFSASAELADLLARIDTARAEMTRLLAR